jgi:hypothetical protein
MRPDIRLRAEISDCGRYRYLLEVLWAPLLRGKILTACMLNPSTASDIRTDATVRWWIGWATKRDYTAIRIVNLAAYRTKSPRKMLAVADPHGPENKTYLVRYGCGRDVVCAWGNGGPKLPRYEEMVEQISGQRLCLGVTKSGQPVHPLRKSHSLELRPWEMPR